MTSALPSAAAGDRPHQRDRLDDAGAVDVLVVGGGITGVGVALLAARRGYRVVLVDRGDLATGTSSRSSKLVHGGARYLATGDLAMVAEGVRERDRLRRAAPHLVQTLPFLIPATSRRDRVLLRTGMTLYDSLAAGRGIGRHRSLSPASLRGHAPTLRRGATAGAVAYWDARTDDARLVLEVAGAAVAAGATVVPYVEVVALRRHGGRVVGADLRDTLTGAAIGLHARVVVSATGVWAEQVRALDPGEGGLCLRPSKGVHLVFPRQDLPVDAAVAIPSAAGDRRRVFVVPWSEQVYVGTTDTPHDGGLDRPAIEPADADYLCMAVQAAFGTTLRPADALAGWAGLRPLLAGRDGQVTRDLSRRHRIVEEPAGLVTVTGGKLTTFARMAAEVVDLVDRSLDRRGGDATVGPLGASTAAAVGRARIRAAAAGRDIDPALAEGLYHRHGDRSGAVLDLCVATAEATPLVPGLPYLTGEVRWAARYELVTHLVDVLRRRLPVALRDREAGGPAVEVAADVLAQELGWDASRRQAEIDAYRAAVRAERGCLPGLQAPVTL